MSTDVIDMSLIMSCLKCIDLAVDDLFGMINVIVTLISQVVVHTTVCNEFKICICS